MSNQVAEPVEGETLSAYRKRNNLPGTMTHLAETCRWINGAWSREVAIVSPVQRALRLAWIEADKKVAHLVDKKPADLPAGNWLDCMNEDREAMELRAAHRDALREWSADWNEALGFRDGLEEACRIAQVPNFIGKSDPSDTKR